MKSIHNQIILDPEDQHLLDEYSFTDNGKKYVKTFLKIDGIKKKIFLHHFILSVKKGFEVDHINRNPLDNRRCNLRYVTTSQNQMNKKMQTNNTSGFRGVSWNKYHKKWQAMIKINKKHIHIGFYKKIDDAATAYQKRAKELFGEYLGEVRG